MPQVNSYTEATNPASGDWIYLDKSDGAGGYDPRKVSPSRFLLADGSVTMTGEFVTDVGTFQSNVADGAANKGFIFDAANGATAGFKIASFALGGAEQFYFDRSGNGTGTNNYSMLATGSLEQRGFRVRSDGSFSFSSTTSSLGTADLFLMRDAANTFAQRNSTNAQTSRIYGTFTDASNYERLSLKTQAGNHIITPEAAGTGTLRNLQLGASGVNTVIAIGGSAPADAELAASQFSAWVNEAGNALTFKVKYADGTTVKSGTVALA